MLTIDANRAIELLREARDERGSEYVYAPDKNSIKCSYLNGTGEKPGCIIGLALHNAGVSLDTLKEIDRYGRIDMVCRMLTQEEVNFKLSNQAIKIFQQAQTIQDIDGNWGMAVEEAEKVWQALSYCSVEPSDSP